MLKKRDVHNAFLRVEWRAGEVLCDLAGGSSRQGEEYRTGTPFHTASIGKMFTATAIGVLVDRGDLHFTDPIAALLPAGILQGLHVMAGVDHTEEITIAHLLQHTSGLPDVFEDATVDGTPNMFERLLAEPDRFWEPDELVRFSKRSMTPLFAPGHGSHYSDTGYILLGMIVERTSGMALPDFFRATFFQPLGMTRTWMNLRSVPLSGSPTMAEAYVGDTEVSLYRSLSADRAGGGIVSTTADLILFHRALLEGRLVSASTLAAMQQWTPESKGLYYGFGLRRVVLAELFPMLPDAELIGHTGSNASFLFHCPQLGTYLAGTFDQVDEQRASIAFPAKVITQLMK